MTAVPWTVVVHAGDDSPPAVTAGHLAAWLADQPSVELHTVVWARRAAGVERFDFGRLRDAGAEHVRFRLRLLRLVKLGRVAGGLAGRAVRGVLADLPRDGVLFLDCAHAAPVLRYLPPGDRTVVTHLHALDRDADPAEAAKLARLGEVTDVWLAADEETRAWGAAHFGVDEASIALVPELIDRRSVERAARPVRRNHLRLGVAGATWFRTDHTPRLVQTLRKLRPELELELVWTEVCIPHHLSPLVHDLEHLGVGGALELPSTDEEARDRLDDIDALVLSTPDDPAPWVAHEASNRGVPVVCFDSHRFARDVPARTGVVVPYLDVVAMAEALLALHDAAADEVESREAWLRDRDVAVVGPRVLDLAGTPVP